MIPFAAYTTVETNAFQRAGQPQKCPFLWWHVDPQLPNGSLDPRELKLQTASGSVRTVHPCAQHTNTDHTASDICSNHQLVASMQCMQCDLIIIIITKEMCSRIDMQTHAGRIMFLRVRVWPLTSGSVHAEVLPWTMSTDFGGDSSNSFPFTARTNVQTDATWTPYHTPAAIQPAWVMMKARKLSHFFPPVLIHL